MQPYVDFAQALISTAAIIVGGIWTYILFIKNRTKFPKLKLSHSLYSRQIDSGRRLIRVTLLMENQSSILVTLNEVTVRLLQLDPWPQDILDRKALLDSMQVSYEWPYIEERTSFCKDVEIEPGESESYHFDFIIDCKIQSIIVYSYVENLSKKNIGWNLSTTHDIMLKEEKMNQKPEQSGTVKRLGEQKPKEALSTKAPPPSKTPKPPIQRQAPKTPTSPLATPVSKPKPNK